MTIHKIVRSLCLFRAVPDPTIVETLAALARKLTEAGYVVQTQRLCTATPAIDQVESAVDDRAIVLSVGTLSLPQAYAQLQNFYAAGDVSFNIDLTADPLTLAHTDILFDMIRHKPAKTFNFTYVFNNPVSSPYFPSARYQQDGFAIGLQPTNLAVTCQSLEAWLQAMKAAWEEICTLYEQETGFLGIDASVAPLFDGPGSLVQVIERLGMPFSQSVVTDTYLTITQYLQHHNPKPVGLCGLMFPCLEDFELAAAYDRGAFSIERNLYLALHSGLGIDTYPIGIDESPETVLHILRLVQGLARKYGKPLSARFVSDGKARIGERTQFDNPYLKDVTIRPLRP